MLGRPVLLLLLAPLGACSARAPTASIVIPAAPSTASSGATIEPTQIARPQLLALGARTCALRSGGSIFCWGGSPGGAPGFAHSVGPARATSVSFMDREILVRTYKGPLMGGAITGDKPFAPVDGLDGLTSISCRGKACCSVDHGVVLCWGSNEGQRLGKAGPDRQQREPVPGLPPASSVVVGAEHACAVLQSGEVYCWGSNRYNQLGDGTSKREYKAPGPVQRLHDVVELATDFRFTCARTSAGEVHCWGDAISGSLGGSSAESNTPVAVRAAPFASAVAVSHMHACALAKDGTVWCWGSNEYGQIGDGTKKKALLAARVPGIDDAIAVATGDYFSCAMKRDESVVCWGQRLGGRLGDGATSQVWSPVAVPGAGKAIGLCEETLGTCAVGVDHRMRCWGYLSLPKLNDKTDVVACTDHCVLHGNGVVDCQTPVKGVAQTAAITGAGQGGCALRNDGAVSCWDSGGGHPKTMFKNATAIAAGYRAACALTQAGELWCWGDVTSHGFTGNKPIVPEGGRGVVAVSMDSAIDLPSACVAYADGTVACWYWDLTVMQEGRLNLRIKQRAGVSDAAKVVGGAEHGCAILRDGRLQCWGPNDAGQLGDGTNDAHKEPVIVRGLSDVVAVHEAREHRCAVTRSGDVFCWGENWSGQLGVPLQKESLKPVPVLGIQTEPGGTDQKRSATRTPR
jgi:alpha-tubulin suppressor-like RCC1 family protein